MYNSIQKIESLEKLIELVESKEDKWFVLEEKIDGQNVFVIVDKSNIEMRTRNGMPIFDVNLYFKIKERFQPALRKSSDLARVILFFEYHHNTRSKQYSSEFQESFPFLIDVVVEHNSNGWAVLNREEREQIAMNLEVNIPALIFSESDLIDLYLDHKYIEGVVAKEELKNIIYFKSVFEALDKREAYKVRLTEQPAKILMETNQQN